MLVSRFTQAISPHVTYTKTSAQTIPKSVHPSFNFGETVPQFLLVSLRENFHLQPLVQLPGRRKGRKRLIVPHAHLTKSTSCLLR